MLSRTQLESISLRQLSGYLSASGWIEDSYRGRPLWVNEFGSEKVSLLLPDVEVHRDFALRIGDLIAVLARFEDRRQEAIYEDVIGVGYDLVRARLLTTKDGSISMSELHGLTDAVFELLREAAAGLGLSARASFVGRYLDAVRVLPAQAGSYVLPIFLPHTIGGPRGEAGRFLDREKDPARQVSERLAGGLRRLSGVDDADLRGQLQRDPELRGFAAPIGQIGRREGDGLEFRFRWSAVTSQERVSEESLDFPAARLMTFFEVAPRPDAPRRIAVGHQQIETARELPEYVLRGRVIRLARPRAVIEGELEGVVRRVTVPLDPAQYRLAITAHAEEVDVRCFGDLLVRSRSARMVKVRSFEVVSG